MNQEDKQIKERLEKVLDFMVDSFRKKLSSITDAKKIEKYEQRENGKNK